jgi:competence protein ComGC
MATINNKIPAFTLFETLVSLLVILVVFALAVTTIVQVQKNNNGKLLFRAHLSIQQMAVETISNKRFFDEIIHEKGYILEKRILEHSQDNMVLVHFVAKRSDNLKIIEEKKVVTWAY